jgi:hypothetical protein
MTSEVMSDMVAFMLILAILIVGNAYVLLLLYPEDLLEEHAGAPGVEWELSDAQISEVEDHFGSVWPALFTSIHMLFDGSSTDLIKDAYSPSLARLHYVLYVSLCPLILLNLLIALMGGSYERIHADEVNEGRRQRAQMLMDLDVLLCPEEMNDPEIFPRWLIFFRPQEQAEEDDNKQREGRSKERIESLRTAVQASVQAAAQAEDHVGTRIDSLDERIDSLHEKTSSQFCTVSQSQDAMQAQLEKILTTVQTLVDESTETQRGDTGPALRGLRGLSRSTANGAQPEPEPELEPEPEPEPEP